MNRMDPVQIAVVGVGGWGKNLARNFHQLPDANLRYVCDLDQKKLDQVARQLPGATLTRDFDAVLRDPEVQAVVIATPAPRHYPIARMALEAGKDVYVEKPFTLEIGHADELIALAEAQQARPDGRAPARVPPGRDAPAGDDRARGTRPPLLHLQPAREPRHRARRRERAVELRAARHLGDHVPARRRADRRRGARARATCRRVSRTSCS